MTNAYLVADSETKEAAVIDPAWDGEVILAEAQKRDWRIAHLWYTHAHFDHIGGAGAIADALNPLPLVALHPSDHTLWRAEGGEMSRVMDRIKAIEYDELPLPRQPEGAYRINLEARIKSVLKGQEDIAPSIR